MQIESFKPKDCSPQQKESNDEMLSPWTERQKKSQTVHNYIDFVSDFYTTHEPQPNMLSAFYPKQLRKNLTQVKNVNPDVVTKGLRAPKCPSSAKSKLEMMKKMVNLQSSNIQLSLQKIDRKSKAIKRPERIINKSLKTRNIDLE